MSQPGATSTAGSAATGNLMNKMMNAGRLVFDGRVPFSLKLMLPVAAVLYWLWPIDLMPGLPFDDIAVLFLALTLFEQLATQALAKRPSAPANQEPGTGDANTVDTTWRVIE